MNPRLRVCGHQARLHGLEIDASGERAQQIQSKGMAEGGRRMEGGEEIEEGGQKY